MSTAVAAWGNSEAVRIPRNVLRSVGLRKGDKVTFLVNERGNIEIVPEAEAHRRVAPARDVTYESVMKACGGLTPEELRSMSAQSEPAWPDDSFVGAEAEAWLR